jgi:sugar O-acyltransferase (sialic acid O-acetyltransferase NeuD family)
VTPQPLILLGASGLAREVLATVRSMPEEWLPIGALDDDAALHGTQIDGLPVLGAMECVHDDESAAVIACIANVRRPAARAVLEQRLALSEERWATLVHPATSLAPGVEIGCGSIVLAGVVITAPQRVGRHVVAMPHVLLTHDDEVGDHVTLAGGVTLGGGVRVRSRAYVGQRAVIREHLEIGEEAVIGMGSVVLCDVPPYETWAGIPAKRMTAGRS